MDITRLDLPTLPMNHAWSVETFQNNEIQAWKPGSKLVMTVKRHWRILGFSFWVRPSSYPAYIIDATSGDANVRATAETILNDHVRYLDRHPELA